MFPGPGPAKRPLGIDRPPSSRPSLYLVSRLTVASLQRNFASHLLTRAVPAKRAVVLESILTSGDHKLSSRMCQYGSSFLRRGFPQCTISRPIAGEKNYLYEKHNKALQ